MAKTKYLDKKGFASIDVMIKYHTGHEPSKETKKSLTKAARLAREIMRSTVWEMDKVFLFRRDAKLVNAVMNHHFHWDKLGDTKADKERLSKVKATIRRRMLHTSVMLHGSNYLLDVDASNRTESDGSSMDGTEGYVSPNKVLLQNKKGTVKVFKNLIPAGPIHVDFDLLSTYSLRAFARIVIHEATHRFCDTDDEAYCHEPAYPGLTPEQCANNADSYAYAALSFHAKALVTHASLEQAGEH